MIFRPRFAIVSHLAVVDFFAPLPVSPSDSTTIVRPLRSTPGCPKAGWKWLRAIDLHDDEGRQFGDYSQCEFCWKEQIRFVHYLSHPDWKSVIAVGRICANELSGDKSADDAEQRLRNRSQRRANFPKLKSWRTSAKGNHWIEYQGHHIVVIRWKTKYRLRIDGELGKLDFEDQRSAKLRAFDVVMQRVQRES